MKSENAFLTLTHGKLENVNFRFNNPIFGESSPLTTIYHEKKIQKEILKSLTSSTPLTQKYTRRISKARTAS
jgi:hypothetical protein